MVQIVLQEQVDRSHVPPFVVIVIVIVVVVVAFVRSAQLRSRLPRLRYAHRSLLHLLLAQQTKRNYLEMSRFVFKSRFKLIV